MPRFREPLTLKLARVAALAFVALSVLVSLAGRLDQDAKVSTVAAAEPGGELVAQGAPGTVQATPTGATLPAAAADAPLLTLDLAPDERRRVKQRGETFLTKDYQVPYTAGPVILSGAPPPTTPFGVDDYLLIIVRRPDGTTARWERIFNPACVENDVIPPQDISSLFQPGLNRITMTISDLCGFNVGTLGRVLLSTPEPPVQRSLLELVLSSPLLWAFLGLAVLGAAGVVVASRYRQIAEMMEVVSWPRNGWFRGAVGAEGRAAAESASETLRPPPSVPLPPRPRRALLTVTGIDSGDQPEETSGRSQVELREAAALMLGSRGDCDILLPAAAAIAPEHARLWLSVQGRIMVHLLAGLPETKGKTNKGKDAGWTALNVGEEMSIGPFVLRYLSCFAETETRDSSST